MELNAEKFLGFYGFDKTSSEDELFRFLLELSRSNRPLLTKFIKNLLTIRILAVLEKENGFRRIPKKMESSLMTVFKKRRFIRSLNKLSDEIGIEFPEAQISGISCFVTLFSVVLWVASIIIFLSRYIEILLSGIEFLLIPFYLVIAMAPYLLLYFLFPGFVAKGHIKGVRSFEDFINSVYELNSKYFRDDNFRNTIKEVLVIQKSIPPR